MTLQKLDDPVGNSLQENHTQFAVNCNGMLFYDPEYCPFGSSDMANETIQGIDEYSKLTPNFYVVGNKPEFSDRVILTKELICCQMILEDPIDLQLTEQILDMKTPTQKQELFELVNFVQPGYFRSKTADLGNYFGIYKEGKLVAVTGERMKMNDFTEVSAVVTHPDYLGKGYAKQLVTHACNQILGENKLPYLHVVETNTGAIGLYEKLGFVTRRKISFWNFVRN